MLTKSVYRNNLCYGINRHFGSCLCCSLSVRYARNEHHCISIGSKNSFHVTLDFPIYGITHIDVSELVFVCVCVMESVCLGVDKCAKSISLDWMKRCTNRAIISVKMISKTQISAGNILSAAAIRGGEIKMNIYVNNRNHTRISTI